MLLTDISICKLERPIFSSSKAFYQKQYTSIQHSLGNCSSTKSKSFSTQQQEYSLFGFRALLGTHFLILAVVDIEANLKLAMYTVSLRCSVKSIFQICPKGFVQSNYSLSTRLLCFA